MLSLIANASQFITIKYTEAFLGNSVIVSCMPYTTSSYQTQPREKRTERNLSSSPLTHHAIYPLNGSLARCKNRTAGKSVDT